MEREEVTGEPHDVGVCRGWEEEEINGDPHDVGVCRGWRGRRSLEIHIM